MKIFSLFICALFLSINCIEAQTEFAPIGAEWYYSYADGCCPENQFYNIFSEEDVVIDGYNCRVLKHYYNYTSNDIKEYIIKQEEGKIYYYYEDKFNLLFDFDVEIGDTIEVTFMYREHSDELPSGKNSLLPIRFKVESIEVDLDHYKTVNTKIVEDDIQYIDGTDVPSFTTYSYHEKVGFYTLVGSPLNNGFVPVVDNLPHPTLQTYRGLRCYSDANYSFMSAEWVKTNLPCDYSISTSNKEVFSKSIINIYPTLFYDNLRITYEGNNGYVEISDIEGRIIYSSKLESGVNKIKTINFLSGVYFVRVLADNGSYQLFKVVKE